jgi:hypothetical protein
MRDSLKYSYSGRLAYLQAIESVWKPRPLATLAPAVKAMREFVVVDGANDLPDGEHGRYATALFWKSFCRKRSPAAASVQDALVIWQKRHKISPTDLWIMDAALQTVAFAVLREGRQPDQWIYYPPEKVLPKFVPKLHNSAWLGEDVESWPSFAKLMRHQFRTELDLYRRSVKAISFSESIEKTEENDATWLARYIGGESWDRIAASIDIRYKAPKSSVRNNSFRLAKRIGLTLPERAAGRRSRR